MFAVAILAGRRSGGRRPSVIIRTGFALSTLGLALIIPIVPDADSGWYLTVPLVIAGAGLGPLVSQLNNYTLAPIDDDRISEAAGSTRRRGRSACRSGWPWPAASCSRPSRWRSRT